MYFRLTTKVYKLFIADKIQHRNGAFEKKIKKTIACVMIAVMLLENSSAVFAAQDGVAGNNVRIISMEEAEQAAIIYIKNVMSTNEESLWNKGVKSM